MFNEVSSNALSSLAVASDSVVDIPDIQRHSDEILEVWSEYYSRMGMEGHTTADSMRVNGWRSPTPLRMQLVSYTTAADTYNVTKMDGNRRCTLSSNETINKFTLISTHKDHMLCNHTDTVKIGVKYEFVVSPKENAAHKLLQSQDYQLPMAYYMPVGYIPGLDFSGLNESQISNVEKQLAGKDREDSIVKHIFPFFLIYTINLKALVDHIHAYRMYPVEYAAKHRSRHVKKMQYIINRGDHMIHVLEDSVARGLRLDDPVLAAVLKDINCPVLMYDLIRCPVGARPYDIFGIIAHAGSSAPLPEGCRMSTPSTPTTSSSSASSSATNSRRPSIHSPQQFPMDPSAMECDIPRSRYQPRQLFSSSPHHMPSAINSHLRPTPAFTLDH